MRFTDLLLSISSFTLLVSASERPPEELAARGLSTSSNNNEIKQLEVAIKKDERTANSLRAQIKRDARRGQKDEQRRDERQLGRVKRRLLEEEGRLKALVARATTTPVAKTTSKARSTSTTTTTRRTTSTTKPATATAASKSSSKKGLGYNTASFTTGFNLAWAYNWADQPGGTLKKGVEFVPMLWGSNNDGFAAAAKAAIAKGSLHILGSNEPDLSSQSNLTPAQAAKIWKANLEPLRRGNVKLVSPAITNGGDPMGVAWMAAFLKACNGCHVDYIAAHWYDSATNVAYFQNYFADMATQFGRPIWITEFAGSGTVAQQQSFFKTIIPWMEKQSFIARYAAFGDFVGTFVNSDGSLTALGKTYRDTV